jgi:hypothetical protein
MATLTAIVTAHEDEQNLRRILTDLHEWQVRKADEIIALASDIDLTALRSEFPKVRFYEEPNLGDWGHAKRAKGLDLATSDYAGWFNHDDSYHPDYILDMMRLAESGNDVVYCGWSKDSQPKFKSGRSTSGNYIVQIDKGRAAGYSDRHYEADGTFINRIVDKANSIVFCDRVLYYHNEVR